MRFESTFKVLEQEGVAIMDRMNDYDPQILNQPTEEGKWSAMQHLVHLNKSERSFLVVLSKGLRNNTPLKGNPLSAALRRIFFFLKISSGIKFKAPKVTEPSTEEFDFIKVRADFEKTRVQLSSILKEITPEQSGHFWVMHPYLKAMRVGDLLKFMVFHQNHHATQVRRILE